jgi:homoserine O-succinyltransferase
LISSQAEIDAMIRAAILDMYNNTPNLGLSSLMDIFHAQFPTINLDLYNVRAEFELPDESYQIYICSGGPGHPLNGNGKWNRMFYSLIDRLWEINKTDNEKKYVFFICHSFQMACHHFRIGRISKRHKKSMGIFPVNTTPNGREDMLFGNLTSPFYAADFREYQVLEPRRENVEAKGAQVLALENQNRDHPKDRALMAVKFSNEFYGTQFHPEAHPMGMECYLEEFERKIEIIRRYGSNAYQEMLFHLRDPLKVDLTYRTILPGFLRHAVNSLQPGEVT